MSRSNKRLALFAILLVAMSILIALTANPVNAQSILPTPSIPQFTISTQIRNYESPTTYYFDQSSGQVIANLGYDEQYTEITLIIKNQDYQSGDSNAFYYNVRVQDSSGGWTEVFNPNTNGYPTPSIGSYTNVIIPSHFNETVGIQVEAMIGSIGRASIQFGSGDKFFGQTSDWSQSQTVTATDITTQLSPTPSPSSGSVPTPSSSLSSPTSTIAAGSSYPSVPLLLTTNLVALSVIAVLLAVITYLLLIIRKSKTASLRQ